MSQQMHKTSKIHSCISDKILAGISVGISAAIPKLALALTLLLSLILGTSCAQNAKRGNNPSEEHSPAFQKVYANSFDTVWRAAQVVIKYPIVINNIDNGQLETDWIRAADGFIPPGSNAGPSAGTRYKIQILMVKGKLDGKDSVRLTLLKRLQKQRDFFSEPEELESDGLEERILLYRIEREISIDEALKKAAKKGKI